MKTKRNDDPLAALEAAASRQAREEEAAKAVSTARARLVLGKSPAYCFFATLALRLKPRPSWDVPTCCTDGTHLDYNPEFFAGLPLEQQKAIVAHEVMHNALGHQARRGHRDPERWNIATDLAVNPVLRDSGLQLPPGRLMPGEGKYKDMPDGKSAEEYYALLEEPPKPQEPPDEGGDQGGDGGGGQGQGEGEGEGEQQGKAPPDPGGCGGVQDPGDGSEAAARQSQADWEVATAQAHQVSRQRGALPGGIDRLVQEILHPKVPWQDVLREFISTHARNDYSWSPPNKRFIHLGIYLPGLRSEELGDLVVAVDTSGSIGETELRVFGGELQGILDAFPDVKLTILYHDTHVHGVQTWSPSDGPLKLEAKGGGGTSHCCVFEWVEQTGDQPTALVCLTDLYTDFPDRGPGYPCLWAVVGGNKDKAPFGQTLEVTT